LIKHEQVAPYRSKDRAEFTGLGAFVTDASGYFAALCVEADFGCNKWQPKIDPVPGQN
jgi:hypothetical protein